MYHNQNFGMMDEGYFVPKSQILNWLNSILQLNLTKIQQLGAGSVYCQVFDIIHPGTITMNKVNWKAKNDYEFIANLKILQNSFAKAGIKKHIQVQKLAKAKYQDNLEFIQWCKRYYDKNCGDRGNQYNAKQRRGGIIPDFSFAEKNVVPKSYNGSGVILPNKGIVAQKGKKKQQITQPNPIKSPVTTKVQTTTTNITKTTDNQSGTKKTTRVSNNTNKVQQVKSNKNISNNKNDERLKDLEMKMCMILEVLKSEQDANMKIGLIQEIMQFKKMTSPSNVKKVENNSNSKSNESEQYHQNNNTHENQNETQQKFENNNNQGQNEQQIL